MRRRSSCWLALLIGILVSTPASANDSPEVSVALDMQPGQFQTNWFRDGVWVQFLSTILAYDLETMHEPFLGNSPVVTVTAVDNAIRDSYGWHHWSSHGSDCLAVEFYQTASVRDAAVTWYLQHGYTS